MLVTSIILSGYFNPRSLAGATVINHHFSVFLIHFNPRSLAGATFLHEIEYRFGKIFQSTLPCGSDMLKLSIMLNQIYFNPRSLAGATWSSLR